MENSIKRMLLDQCRPYGAVYLFNGDYVYCTGSAVMGELKPVIDWPYIVERFPHFVASDFTDAGAEQCARNVIFTYRLEQFRKGN